jgi:alpha-ketoglutarate-dependent taurine dioxygenase
LQIKPLSEHVGAEISGVNLAADLADDTFEKIDDAYNRYSVLVFRDQKLTPEQQIAFARRFGELEISPRTQFALPGHPEILVLSNIIENGQPIGNAGAGRTWHTDMSYTKTPPRGSLLYALEIPIEKGRALGDTVFASAAAAFESLPADKQASLLGLRAIHRGSAKKYAPGSKLGDLVKDIPDVDIPSYGHTQSPDEKPFTYAKANASGFAANRTSKACPSSRSLRTRSRGRNSAIGISGGLETY